MSRKHLFAIPAAAAVLALALFAGSGCSSKSSNPTAPGGGGGGGGGENFASGNFTSASVQGFVHTFTTAGSFAYSCTIHSMPGTVNVAASGPDSVTVNIVNFAFSPTPVTVKTGGYVHWINTVGTAHNVTR